MVEGRCSIQFERIEIIYNRNELYELGRHGSLPKSL